MPKSKRAGTYMEYPLAATLVATAGGHSLFLCEPKRLKVIDKDGDETLVEADPEQRKARAGFKLCEGGDSDAFGGSWIPPDRMVALGKMFTEASSVKLQNGAGKPLPLSKLAVGVALARTKAKLGVNHVAFEAGTVDMGGYIGT